MTAHTFAGFSPAIFVFLDGLESNNNKEWFEAHKEIYKNEIMAQAPDFVTALGERLQAISPNITYDTRTNGAGSMMRIYRDTRFSKDKTPYKTNLAFVFGKGRVRRWRTLASVSNLARGDVVSMQDSGALPGSFYLTFKRQWMMKSGAKS